MTAYTDSQKIAAYLGATLTGAQATQAGVMADAATAWIDRYLGRTWQTTSPVNDELHGIIGDRVYLTHSPVVAVSSVKTRDSREGSTVTTLTADQYEVLDARNGLLVISGWAIGDYLALVSYTHSVTAAPADVGVAATMIASAWMGGALAPGANGVESMALGQNDINIKYAATRSDVPVEALSILDGYRQIVIA